MTTFLALIVLADSTSHAFLTFFKVFFLTVVIGMFHGVVFLPVLLSCIGGQNAKHLPNDIQLSAINRLSASDDVKKQSNYNNLSFLDKITIYITGVNFNAEM